MKDGFTSLRQYLECLQSKGQYSFLRGEEINALNITDKSFKRSVGRLMQQGKINRIRGNFYIIVPPEYQASGSLPSSWFIDALMNYLEQPYYCGLLNSAALLGTSH